MANKPTGTTFEARRADWLDVETARARIISAAPHLAPETVPLSESLGRALSEPIDGSATLPPWDNSAMDGYAVRGADVQGADHERPVALPVSGVVRAGDPQLESFEEGSAVRIMTGAPVPRGADSIIRVEDTDAEAEPGTVLVQNDRDIGRHVRPAGQDMTEGLRLFDAGHTVSAGSIGVLAAAGLDRVPVRTVPTVAFLPTGDELRRPDRYEDVRNGVGVPESNATMLCAAARAIACAPLDLGIAADDTEAISQSLDRAADADVLVTIGGASMGEADLVKRVLDAYGFELDFWRVKMRPGSPISFGWITRGDRRQAVFGLPGNPSSAFVTFELFVRPYLLRLAGHEHVDRPRIPCIAAERFTTPAALTYFQRVRLHAGADGISAGLTGPQLSGLVRGLASADGLAVIPPEVDVVEPGDPVSVLWFGNDLGSSMG